MKYDFSNGEMTDEMIYIKDNIVSYLTDRGIDSERLYFHDLPILKAGDNRLYLNKTSTIDELYKSISDGDSKIVINVNGQYAEHIFTVYPYWNLGLKDVMPEFDWKKNIKWCYI